MKSMFENMKIKRDLRKDGKMLVDLFSDKKTSEIKKIINENEEIKAKVEDILGYFGNFGNYGLAFLDDSTPGIIEESKIFRLRKKDKEFLKRIEDIFKFNKEILDSNEMNLNLDTGLDVDYLYDILTNKTYDISSKQLANLYKGLINSANINIKSDYIFEIMDLFVKHKSFTPKLFDKLLSQVVLGHNLNNSFFKIILIFAYFNTKTSLLNEFLLKEQKFLVPLENFLIAEIHQGIKIDFVRQLNLDVLEILHDRIKNNRYGNTKYMIELIESEIIRKKALIKREAEMERKRNDPNNINNTNFIL